MICRGKMELLTVRCSCNESNYIIINLKHRNLLQTGLAANTSAESLTQYLQSIQNIGTLQIQRSGDCAGYNWNVRWNQGGKKDILKVNLIALKFWLIFKVFLFFFSIQNYNFTYKKYRLSQIHSLGINQIFQHKILQVEAYSLSLFWTICSEHSTKCLK